MYNQQLFINDGNVECGVRASIHGSRAEVLRTACCGMAYNAYHKVLVIRFLGSMSYSGITCGIFYLRSALDGLT